MLQFALLQVELGDIFDHASRAERLAHSDPRAAAFYCRGHWMEPGRHTASNQACPNPVETPLRARTPTTWFGCAAP
jgi:hypothetical protein